DGVPDPNRQVVAGRGQAFAVGTEGHARHFGALALECEDLLTRHHVPDLYQVARGRQPLAVRAESNAAYRTTMAHQFEDFLTRCRVTDLDVPAQVHPVSLTLSLVASRSETRPMPSSPALSATAPSKTSTPESTRRFWKIARSAGSRTQR